MHAQPDTIEQKLDEARRRLLDMSRRNRLLNYRAGGNRSLKLVDADPAAVYRLLMKGDKVRIDFLAAEEAGLKPEGEKPGKEKAAEAAPSEEHSAPPPEVEVKEKLEEKSEENQDKTAPPRARKPHELATRLAAEALDRRLLFLDRESESALQEQGCNILYLALGMLGWKDTAAGSVVSNAPLVLVPVDLLRSGVGDRHHLVLWDQEITVNPALKEMCRREYRLSLPNEIDSETDLDAYFQSVANTIEKLPGWTIQKDVHLGLFSFAKLLMYLDLDPARWPEQSLASHALVRGLCGLPIELPECGECMPADKLDEVPPRDTFQVLDADSSQQVAILAAKSGTSMVIEGPPGTGKSQTITNIIAECLSQGKTVLFVAEKAAALEVVKRRLDNVQLGDFVLELHSRKASKRQIIEELGRVMNATYPPAPRFDLDARELEQLRARLNSYVRLLHQPRTALEKSLFEAMSEFAPLRSAVEAPVDMSTLVSASRDEFARMQELVSLLSRAASRLGDMAVHPWRGVGLTEISLDQRQKLPVKIEGLRGVIGEIQSSSTATCGLLAAPAPKCRAEAQQLLDLASVVLQTRSITPKLLQGPPWPNSTDEVDEVIKTGRSVHHLRAQLAEHWKPDAENLDWREVLERRTTQLATKWRWLQPQFYRDNKLIRQYSDYPFLPPPVVGDDLLNLVNLGQQKQRFASLQPLGQKCFGELWRGLDSDWQVLADHATAMQRITKWLIDGRTSIDALIQVCTPEGRPRLKAAAQQFVTSCNALLNGYKEFGQALGLDFTRFLGRSAEEAPFEQWSKRLDECTLATERMTELTDFNFAVRNCETVGLEKFVIWTGEHYDLTAKWPGIFKRQFLASWIDRQNSQLPEFREFAQLDHNALIERFRQADKRWLAMSQQRLAGEVAERRPQRASTTAKSSRLGVLEAEMRRKRGLKPIRQLFAQVGDVVQALKPCLMMSPISVAQYLEAGGMQFDVVIFDEASQVEPADALGAVARGKQLILVGDEKQLPPTNFFNQISQAEEPSESSDDSIDTRDLESVLAQGMVVLRRTTLRWHYRSQHSSLIEFSNNEFYSNELRVFPSPQVETGQIGLSFRHVTDGVYLRGKGQYNPLEAQAVADAVIEHARANPQKSLGVGAFSVAQQVAIQDAIEQLRSGGGDSQLERFFGRETNEPFFVKNLETIQGDERDTIFLSVGYGPDQNGKVGMNFGPVNKDGGWRRLNVLVTRAREQCIVFSSLTSDQLGLKPDTPRGVKALKEYLHFAQHGALPAVGGNTGDHDSPFEKDVAEALRSRGWVVDSQIGTAGFSIDLAVVDPKAAGRYLLGIECDGATYHSAATARDRDRLRQAVLERLGWTLHRIWSTEWFERRDSTLKVLLERLDELNKRQEASTPTAIVEATGAETKPKSGEPAPEKPVAEARVADKDTPKKPVVKADADAPTLLRGVTPYARYPARSRGSREKLLAGGFHMVTDLLVDVVAIEGPVHVEEAMRIVAGQFSARVSGKSKDRLLDAVELAVRSGRVQRRGDFLWHCNGLEVPVRWRGEDDAVTSPQLIPPEEVAAAAVLVAQQSFGVPADDLAAAALRAMGFKRITQPLAELGRAGVDLAIQDKRLAADASGFLIPAQPGSNSSGS